MPVPQVHGQPEGAPATAGSNSPEIAVDAVDLKEIRSAVVDPAGVSAGLWLSYLFVLFYLLIAAGAVTHRDLFLANPIKLPFLSVELPLQNFFWLGPALFPAWNVRLSAAVAGFSLSPIRTQHREKK